jgi:hypothetical protein
MVWSDLRFRHSLGARFNDGTASYSFALRGCHGEQLD